MKYMVKTFFTFVAIAAFTSCSNNGKNDSPTNSAETADTTTMSSKAATATVGDSIKRASDSVMQTGDTSALNSVLGDSSSNSGSHGQGSGSRVGGGKTGGPQKKNSKK